MDELLVFSPTFEGLFQKALGDKLDAKTRERLRAIGVNLDKPLEPAYPFATWMKAIAVCAEDVHTDVSPVEGRRRLGQALVTGYRETFIGRAMLRYLKIKGVRKAIETCRKTFKSGNNYTETTITEIGPNCVELWMNIVGEYPEFTAGIIEAGVEVAGGTERDVRIVSHDGTAATYRITWK